MALFIGIPYGTNASMSIESFLQKRNSNNPLEQIRNPLQWKHDSKRKVSQYVKSHNIALLNNFRVVHSALYRLWCTSKWLHGFLTSIFENFKSSYEPSRQRYAEYKRSRNCCKKTFAITKVVFVTTTPYSVEFCCTIVNLFLQQRKRPRYAEYKRQFGL